MCVDNEIRGLHNSILKKRNPNASRPNLRPENIKLLEGEHSGTPNINYSNIFLDHSRRQKKYKINSGSLNFYKPKST